MTDPAHKTTRVSTDASLAEKIRRLIFGPEHDPNMSPIMSNTLQTGFRYKGSEFIHHTDLHITESAFFNLLRHQKILFGVTVGLLVFALFLNWQITLIMLFGVLTILYFFDLIFSAFIIFRSYKALPEIRISAEEVAGLRDDDCPTYTIFCPLYKEWQVAPQFVEAMQKLDYPHEKLQVLFLLEENDTETIEKIGASSLPPHFQILVVPHSKPKTKPKAMNYGLNYVSGEYVVIYDAEDMPEVDQLKKAVLAFKKVGADVACIQAKLNFYNPQQNTLTRLFSAEYSLWFDLVLPGFQSISAPIPLGGTSNHFKIGTLRELGGWDAFNVTEDCDLGMRLAKRGYKTAIVDSTTHEEANSDVLNWYNQRSRWIKGYMQTYFVHMRNPKKYFSNGKGKDFFLFQLIVGGKILSLFINPLMWITTICYFLFRADLAVFIEPLFPGPILYIGVFSLVFGNFLYLYYYMLGCVKRGYDGLIKYIFLVPFYWLGMSFAAWQALYEIIVKPHYWAKTVHGLHLAPAQTIAQAPWTMNAPSPTRVAFDMKAVLMNQPPRTVMPMASQIVETPVAAVVGAMPDNEPELVHILSGDTGKETWFTKVRAFITSSAGLLVMSSVVANIINFTFNVYLGRHLNFEDFGTVTLISTLVYLLNLFINGIGTTLNHTVSYLEGIATGKGSFFFRHTWLHIFIPSIIGSIVWFVSVPFISDFFHMSGYLVIAAFAPAIFFGSFNAYNAGYLQGMWSFGMLAFLALFESSSRLAAAVILVSMSAYEFTSLAIPISIFLGWAGSTACAALVYRKIPAAQRTAGTETKFSLSFYAASLMKGFSIAMVLSVDVILAKHYLSPYDAGVYALLSTIGKMIYFFGSLLNVFIVSMVSRAMGKGRGPEKEFGKIFVGTAFLSISAGLGLSLFGWFLAPLLLGASALTIVPYLIPYSIAMTLFTLATTIVLYQLARERYFFPAISLVLSLAMLASMVLHHSSVAVFVQTAVAFNVIYFLIIAASHIFYSQLLYAYRNIYDVVIVYKTLPLARPHIPGKKNILVFNWRDTKSVFAGGAETYVQALASRWVKDGHTVTLFTSNDGHLPPNGETDGVRIIRRGGFYATYVIASIYYLVHFRGKFDVIVDSENGIPFFTPLYASEPVYCLVHHIHQDVFRKSLVWPLSSFACFLEKELMPLVYRDCNFITVSDSSKQAMETLQITTKDIQVVNPGIDTSFLTPGEKAPVPTVSYVGRLKEHKSVHLLIEAFKEVLARVPDAQLIIAGDGEEENKLKRLTQKLHMGNSVSFRGKVSEEEKRDILRTSWVFVTPSMIEGWGITTIEANACGTPVIASDVSGLRDSVRDGETGLLVPYGDAGILAEKIILILIDGTLRNILSRYAIEWAQNFEWQKNSKKFIEIISNPKEISPVPVTKHA